MDLNLLTALEALLTEGSVTGAAQRLHVSVPGMSRTLARLRRTTGDELLVRAGREMVLTPRALELRPQVTELLRQTRAALSPEPGLDPARLRRTFTLRWHDAGITAHAAGLTARMRRQAPGVRLRFLGEQATDSGDDLRRGDVDLYLAGAVPAQGGLESELLAHDELVAVMRRGHPLARKRLTVERFTAAEHATASRRGRLRDPVDDALEAAGAARTVVVAGPAGTAVLHLVAGSDLLTVVPRQITRTVVAQLGLVVKPLPLPMPPVPLHQFWHRRHDQDPAHRWLRSQVRSQVREPLRDSGS
ncbi:LysR family transcriptional regulator [Kineosporia sp. J2-2]|uniref:LysR family transcriptional regulator n=1 Tax=Kineosporia corallincola TaxID=2835133 RepID=A0ABS5TRF3_9ACTN|nr:LysR family transcriptional regulator [Kineosporia corallincola]MBT0773376.1 LysR family transcriptional regulator [Kineosporia corallincola]